MITIFTMLGEGSVCLVVWTRRREAAKVSAPAEYSSLVVRVTQASI